MMDVENQLLQEMNGLGQVYCLFTVFSMSDVGLCLRKTYAHPNQRGWMQTMTWSFIVYITLFTLKFKIHQLHVVRLY